MWSEISIEDAYGFLLIFTRIGAVFMFIPTFGSGSVPARFRLVMALIISLLIFIMFRGKLPPMPVEVIELVVVLLLEVTKGIMIAMVPRFILSALHVAGTIIGFQGGLAAAQQFDPNQGQQGALLAAFFTFLGVVVIFTSDLHLLLIHAMVNSYVLFPASEAIVIGDFTEVIVSTLAGAFQLGLQLASPFIVYAMVYNISLGVVARLMPQLPVFFVGMPLNLFIGLFLLSVLISAIMMWFGQYFESEVASIFI